MVPISSYPSNKSKNYELRMNENHFPSVEILWTVFGKTLQSFTRFPHFTVAFWISSSKECKGIRATWLFPLIHSQTFYVGLKWKFRCKRFPQANGITFWAWINKLLRIKSENNRSKKKRQKDNEIKINFPFCIFNNFSLD